MGAGRCAPLRFASASLTSSLAFNSSRKEPMSCQRTRCGFEWFAVYNTPDRPTLPDFLLIASFAWASFASSFALAARLTAIFSRRSASFCFFSSSVKGLIYIYTGTARNVRPSPNRDHDRKMITDLLGRLFKLIVPTLLRVEVGKCGVPERLAANRTFDTLSTHSHD